MKTRKLISILLAGVMLLSLLPMTASASTSTIFASGSGTEDDPFVIETLTQLKAFRNDVNNGNNYSGEYIVLANDINLGGSSTNQWTPIADANVANVTFNGTFDGNGREISGLYIDKSGETNLGLFGYTVNGTIKNLTVDGTVRGYSYVGGIAGTAFSSGNLINCHNKATVNGDDSVGGIVGYAYMGTVKNCYNSGTLGSGSNSASKTVGGIVGFCQGSNIEDCYNTGAITGASKYGGIVGKFQDSSNTTSVARCINRGTVSKKSESSSNPGAIVGELVSSHLSDCYFTQSGALTGVGDGSNTDTTAVASANLLAESSYSALDFDDVWLMGTAGPILQSCPEGKGAVIIYADGTKNFKDTLRETATAAANSNGATIKLFKDVAAPAGGSATPISFSGVTALTIDLNGKAVDDNIDVENATLTVDDTSLGKLGYMKGNLNLKEGANLTLNAGRYAKISNSTSTDISYMNMLGSKRAFKASNGEFKTRSSQISKNASVTDLRVVKCPHSYIMLSCRYCDADSPFSNLTYDYSPQLTYKTKSTFTASFDLDDEYELSDVSYEWKLDDTTVSNGSTYEYTPADLQYHSIFLQVSLPNGAKKNMTRGIQAGKATAAIQSTATPATGLVYDGTEQALLQCGPAVPVEMGDVKYSLSENGSYTLVYPFVKDAGDYTVWYRVEENEYYNASQKYSVDVSIAPKQVSIAWDSPNSFDYNGLKQTYGARVTNAVTGDTVGLTFTGNEATDKGDYTARVTGTTNTNYTTEGISNGSSAWKILQATNEITAPLSISDWTYGDTQSTPTVTFKFGTPSFEYLDATQVTLAGVPTDAGNYYVKASVVGNNNYTGLASTAVPFSISKKALTASDVTAIPNQSYTGFPIEPAVQVNGVGGALTPNVDYTVTYENNTETGVAKAKIEIAPQCANYTGSIEKTFNIVEKKISTDLPLVAPVSTGVAQTSFSNTEYDATVTWSPLVTKYFYYGTVYTATITITPKANYTLNGIAENEFTVAGATTVTNSANSGVVTVVFPETVAGGGGSLGNSTVSYTVQFNSNGGSDTASQSVERNSSATEPKAPTKSGFVFDGWYTDANLTQKYSFSNKVTRNLTLYAKWVEEELPDDTGDDDGDEPIEEWKNPFTDVSESDWFYNSVKFVLENGIMSGTSKTEFSPKSQLTRSMLVAVLYRLDGSPIVGANKQFSDVSADAYYADAVAWAKENGIVSGVTDEQFAPDENITREQIAAIIYRYAKYKGYDVSQGGMQIREFDDFGEISEYALDAMTWAVNCGLMQGKGDNKLAPQDLATRAEISAILQRFIEANK